MPKNTQLDSIEFEQIKLPYDRISTPVSETPRLVNGLNVYTTLGGGLGKRPGTVEFAASTGSALRPIRTVLYETMEPQPKVYIMGSFYNPAAGTYAAYYNRPSANSGWISVGTLRGVNNSTAPHEFVVSRGLCYIRAIPSTVLSGDKYGTVVFDGTTATTRFWGLPSPTVPAAIVGEVATLDEDIDASTVAFDVSNPSFGVTAGDFVQIEYEQMEVASYVSPLLTVVARGGNGTTASPHPQGTIVLFRDGWAASTNYVSVKVGWAYTYSYKSSTGHISNRAPLETDPGDVPSITGPFTNLIPKITVPGDADTSNIPSIVIYRSTDGSTGPFYELETITNTGATSITYIDDSLASVGDPLPDTLLTNNVKSPTLTSNSPPPTVLAPLVTGVADPVQGTPLASYQSRIWYAIGNILFYSANEELSQGIPEESFPSGIRGNYWRLQYPVTNTIATNQGEFIFTQNNCLFLSGNNIETFNIQPMYENIGMLSNHPRSMARFGDKVAFLSSDLRIIMSQGTGEYEVISDPLGNDISNAIQASASAECELAYFGSLEKEWVIVAVHRPDDPTQSRQWVFDIKLSREQKRYFWFPPWDIPSVSMLTQRYLENNNAQRVLGFFIWSATSSYGRFVYVDVNGTTATDVTAGTGGSTPPNVGISYYFDTFLHKVPPGNHVNSLRSPALSPNVLYLSIERTSASGDEDPEIFYFFDDTWTTPIPAAYIEPPARRQQSKGYKTLQPQVNQVAYRFAFRVRRNGSVRPAMYQSYAVVYCPDSGA